MTDLHTEHQPVDLFEDVASLPTEVQAIVASHELDREYGSDLYDSCRNLKKELEAVGYTCDYSLDGVPFDLRKIAD